MLLTIINHNKVIVVLQVFISISSGCSLISSPNRTKTVVKGNPLVMSCVFYCHNKNRAYIGSWTKGNINVINNEHGITTISPTSHNSSGTFVNTTLKTYNTAVEHEDVYRCLLYDPVIDINVGTSAGCHLHVLKPPNSTFPLINSRSLENGIGLPVMMATCFTEKTVPIPELHWQDKSESLFATNNVTHVEINGIFKVDVEVVCIMRWYTEEPRYVHIRPQQSQNTTDLYADKKTFLSTTDEPIWQTEKNDGKSEKETNFNIIIICIIINIVVFIVNILFIFWRKVKRIIRQSTEKMSESMSSV